MEINFCPKCGKKMEPMFPGFTNDPYEGAENGPKVKSCETCKLTADDITGPDFYAQCRIEALGLDLSRQDVGKHMSIEQMERLVQLETCLSLIAKHGPDMDKLILALVDANRTPDEIAFDEWADSAEGQKYFADLLK